MTAGQNEITFIQRKAGGDLQYDYLRLGAPGTSGAPLPVTLVAFKATATGLGTVARATASEVNSARFEVKRSVDGVAFARIGQVAAADSKTTQDRYTLLDQGLLVGATTFYCHLR